MQKAVPKVAVVIPFIGYAAIALQTKGGLIVIGLGIILLIILFILSELWRKDEDEDEDDEESEDEVEDEYEEDDEEEETLSRKERRRLKKEEKRRRKEEKRRLKEEEEDEEYDVSYTHLDVYKRQAEVRSGSGRPIPASVSFVPGVAGLMIAGEVIKDLVFNKK